MSKAVNDPDAPLVKSFQERHDRKSFDVLYDKYKDGIFNYCLRFLGDEDEAADCTQEIFIRVFRHMKGFRRGALFSTWLFRIAINNCNSHAQSMKARYRSHNEKALEQLEDHSPDPSRALSGKEAMEAFQAALLLLNENQRSLVILRDLEGRSYEEIAQMTHMKLGTVKSALARARYQMAANLNIYRNGM